MPAVKEDTIICLVMGPKPKIAKVSFQTACLDLQNINRNNSFLAINSEGTYNIITNVKISSENCNNSNNGLKSDDETTIEAELDLAELTLDEANQQKFKNINILTEHNMISDYQNQAEILEKQVELLDFASNIQASLQLIQPAASIANFIFSFILPSDLVLITNLMQLRLNQINGKLDKLLNNLNLMETSIKSSIAFNTFISTYMDWEYAIRNGAMKLRNIRHQMGLTRDKRRLRNLALDYITYYNSNRLEGKMINLYRVSVTANNPTNRNLFDLFIEHHSCDVTQLSGLMIILKNLMTNAAQQIMTYYYFRGEKARSQSWYENIKVYLFQMRQEFQKRVYFCMRNTIDNAKKEVEQSLGRPTVPLPELLVQFILKKLSVLFPWYAWGVAEFEQILGSSCNSELMRKGTNYFFKKDGQQKRNILVVWQDANQISNCIDINCMKTLVPYLRCDKCNNNHAYASQNVLTKTRCPEALNPRCNRNNIKLTKGLQWDWIAADTDAHSNRCQEPEACNNHGSCFSVPDTSQFVCICYPMYEGKTCDKRIVSNYDILSHLTTLRKEFMVANGVPTIVDVYFELQNGLKASLNEIKDALQYTQNLVKHSEILYQASYIVKLYLDLKQGKVSLVIFGELLEKFLQINSVHYITFRLKGIILGEGIADVKGEDIFNVFKKSYVSKFKNACTKTYSTVVNNLKTNLVYLDEAIGEALLMFKQWQIQKGSSYSLKRLGSFVDEFKARQNSYHSYWKNTSCPSLIVPDLIENFCTEKLSFENMSVQLSCSDHKVPSPSSVQCVRREGQLVWSTIPKCNYQWAVWGSWSACSVTCGPGKRYRTRECMGHETSRCGSASRQEMVCNEKKCCLSKDGNYACSIGQCIRQSQLERDHETTDLSDLWGQMEPLNKCQLTDEI
ncbi:SE-cephalotoxin-like [Stegostoma tigrinum]|uniref:SE-cephalotoxin-like n=1 Tax=Stegostoma tigrinum TaxID=3053191 RepID=UPI002870AE1F|nr:SE-cephalotoxin-like [Stegostoma tigrinum]